MAIFKPIDRETISDLSSSVGFTASKLPPTIPGVIYARIQPISGNIRFTVDGTTPTTSLGLKLLENSMVEIWGAEALAKFRCIDDGGTATLEVVYAGGGA